MMSAKTRPISRPTALPSRWSTRATSAPTTRTVALKADHLQLSGTDPNRVGGPDGGVPPPDASQRRTRPGADVAVS
jgi:hypothetical protein